MRIQNAKITYLDGVRLYRAIVAGIRQVISQQEYLNNINVFPVPDRDTGTNMALTLNAVLESTYSHHNAGIRELLDTIANAALSGARGNSGAILAQFFQGLSEGAKSVNDKMTTKHFVAAIATAVNHAHKALSQPKEGTILTILRDFSDEITHQQLANAELDFVDLLSFGIQRANQSLQHTSVQLKELRKAGVVDAGAQGFVEFLNGIHHFVLNGSIKQLQEEIVDIEIKATPEELVHEIDERFRYCTECLIIKREETEIDQDDLRNILDEVGNSLIVAGSGAKTKIHIHTNDPNKIFDICRQYGHVSGEKADDMIHQQKSFSHRKNRVAILTDSGADIPEALLSSLNIHVVPILINFGRDTYLDKVSLTAAEFYQLIRNTAIQPTTSQPSFGDFHRQYQYLSTHYDATIALHIPNLLSGTMTASEKASEKVINRNQVIVMDTLNAAAGQGLIVARAAEAAQAGCQLDEIQSIVHEAIQNIVFFFAITQLEFSVRGGRIPLNIKRLFDALKLVPVLSFAKTGRVKLSGFLFGRQQLPKKMFRLTKRKIQKNKRYRIIVTHTDCEDQAQQLKTWIEKAFPAQIEQIFLLPLCASLAVHAGPKALGVAMLEYSEINKASPTGVEPVLSP